MSNCDQMTIIKLLNIIQLIIRVIKVVRWSTFHMEKSVDTISRIYS